MNINLYEILMDIIWNDNGHHDQKDDYFNKYIVDSTSGCIWTRTVDKGVERLSAGVIISIVIMIIIIFFIPNMKIIILITMFDLARWA